GLNQSDIQNTNVPQRGSRPFSKVFIECRKFSNIGLRGSRDVQCIREVHALAIGCDRLDENSWRLDGDVRQPSDTQERGGDLLACRSIDTAQNPFCFKKNGQTDKNGVVPYQDHRALELLWMIGDDEPDEDIRIDGDHCASNFFQRRRASASIALSISCSVLGRPFRFKQPATSSNRVGANTRWDRRRTPSG